MLRRVALSPMGRFFSTNTVALPIMSIAGAGQVRNGGQPEDGAGPWSSDASHCVGAGKRDIGVTMPDKCAHCDY
jgi:hypothetical protein